MKRKSLFLIAVAILNLAGFVFLIQSSWGAGKEIQQWKSQLAKYAVDLNAAHADPLELSELRLENQSNQILYQINTIQRLQWQKAVLFILTLMNCMALSIHARFPIRAPSPQPALCPRHRPAAVGSRTDPPITNYQLPITNY